MTKAIILAAGAGRRLRPYADDRPKGMVELWGKPLLHYQLETLAGEGIDNIVVVTGYKADQINHPDIPLRYISNPRWETTNMVVSLFSAVNELNGDVIVSYADIVYQKSLLKNLLLSDSMNSVVVDTGFKSYWEMRFDNPLSDVESLEMSENLEITNIGQKVESIEDVQAQYIGLMKFASEGTEILRNILDGLAKVEGFDDMYMTDLLQYMIDNGHNVKAVTCHHGWLEVDTVSDLKNYQMMMKDGSIKRFFDQEE
jgi:choline kinase